MICDEESSNSAFCISALRPIPTAQSIVERFLAVYERYEFESLGCHCNGRLSEERDFFLQQIQRAPNSRLFLGYRYTRCETVVMVLNLAPELDASF